MAFVETSTLEDGAPDISICIATFRRPHGLARLLDSLLQLVDLENVTMEVIIVDNDVNETARLVSESRRCKFPRLHYYVEPRQNIAHARNRAVQAARGTWIAFIDDDEVPASNWLAAYWKMCLQRPADGYFGPVLPRLEGSTPAWMDKDFFFGRPHYAHGEQLYKHLRTGNAFIRRPWFETHKFDPRLGLTGGSDPELFARMLDSGAKFYWCDNAETFEYYPPERLRLSWLLKRSFRGGYTYTLRETKRHPRCTQRVIGLVKAACVSGVFTLMLPFELLRGRRYAVGRLRRIAMQYGHIWGFLNLTYEAYRVKS